VRFLGYQSQSQVKELLEETDVFVLPSFAEGVPVVLMEAMAAGVPVVAARATGAVDLVDEGMTGFLVPPRDIHAYADAIARIVTDPALRRAMGEAGTAKATGYNWDSANQAVLDAYLALAGG
jgi:glycosyltransferase involved in cell wall biosynthesis